MLKALWNFKSFIKDRAVTETITCVQSNRVEEVHYVKLIWVKVVQKSLQLMNNSVRQFNVFVDNNGLLCCGGRINNANVLYNVKFPYLIPKSHYFTKSVVIYAHAVALYNGVRETLNFIRSQYWIIQGCNFVRKTIHECSSCKRYKGKSYSYPEEPQLPKQRVSKDHVFRCIGIN